MRFLIFLLAVTIIPFSAMAQENFMEAQRCVWACLRNDGGGDAASPAYALCVRDRCGADGMPSQANADVVIEGDRWESGRSEDGRSFASIETQGENGTIGLYYFCAANEGLLILFGLEGSARNLRLTIGSQVFDVQFRAGPDFNWIEADLSSSSPLLVALQDGTEISFRNDTGKTILALTLRGSTEAIQLATAAC